MIAAPLPPRAVAEIRLAQIADFWVTSIPLDERLIRKTIRDQVEEEGLLFDQKQINAAIRRAWNRLPDEEREASRHGLPATPAPTPTESGSYNQDQDEDQDQDQNQETTAPIGKRERCGPDAPAPPTKLSPWAEDAEIYDLLERYHCGQLYPAPVQLGPMPSGATESMLKVADDLALLIGLRLAVDDDRPLIYSTSFCAWRMGWATSTGAPEKPRASRVLRRLIDTGVIECVGTMPRTDSRLFAAPSVGVGSDQDQRLQPSASSLDSSHSVKSTSSALCTRHSPLAGSASGLSHRGTPQVPDTTIPALIPVGNSIPDGFHHRHEALTIPTGGALRHRSAAE